MWLLASVLLILGACRAPEFILPDGFLTPTPNLARPVFSEDEAALQSESALTPTPQTETAGACAYTWTRQALPEVTKEAKRALERAGLGVPVEVTAETYGENCINTVTKSATGFTVVETDFRVVVTVENLEDMEMLGGILRRIIETLLALPLDTYPGTRMGYGGIRFTDGLAELNLWFELQAGKDAIERGLQGAALLFALQ
ncbi:MAG: hypothetical protein IT308_02175 [Anaerolineaceae bacterium]|nr:hypothetical protein [Anaerolineaceae bacterium]